MDDRVYNPKRRRRKITNKSHNRDNTNDNDWEAFVRPPIHVQQPQQATITPKLTSTTVVNEPTTTLSRAQRDENWKTKNSEQDCTGTTQPCSLINEINANGGKSIDDKHHDYKARMLNQKMPPNPKIKRWDSPLCLKQSIQSPLYGQRDSFHHRIDPLQSHIRMSSTVIGAPTKPDDDTPLTEILRAAGDGNNHLVQSSRIPIKSVMVEEEITYAQLGDFDTKEFKEVFNLKLGPTMKILKAAKQYNTSKPKKFLTSPGESNKKMPAADSSATMWGAPFHSVLHPDHSTTTVAMNKPNVPPPDHSTTTVAMKKPNDSYDDLGIDQSKLGDEIKQLRKIMTKMLPDTKDTSKDNEKIDEKTTELIRQIKFLDNESLLTNSLKNYKTSRDWYNNRFNNTWNDDDPRVIVQRFTEFCTRSFLTGDIMASTCKNKLMTCKFLLLRQGKMVNDSAIALLDTAISYWNNKMRNRIQGGQENANPNLTEDDSLHIIGTIMKIYPDGIPNNIFQEILKLVFTQRVGRRMHEIH